MSEIDQITHRLARNTHIIDHLRLVFGGEFRNRFELDNHGAKNVQIGDVTFLEFSCFVKNREFLFAAKRDGS